MAELLGMEIGLRDEAVASEERRKDREGDMARLEISCCITERPLHGLRDGIYIFGLN